MTDAKLKIKGESSKSFGKFLYVTVQKRAFPFPKNLVKNRNYGKESIYRAGYEGYCFLLC